MLVQLNMTATTATLTKEGIILAQRPSQHQTDVSFSWKDWDTLVDALASFKATTEEQLGWDAEIGR